MCPPTYVNGRSVLECGPHHRCRCMHGYIWSCWLLGKSDREDLSMSHGRRLYSRLGAYNNGVLGAPHS